MEIVIINDKLEEKLVSFLYFYIYSTKRRFFFNTAFLYKYTQTNITSLYNIILDCDKSVYGEGGGDLHTNIYSPYIQKVPEIYILVVLLGNQLF